MSTADAWRDEEGSVAAREREPIEVVISRIILAFGLSVALGVIAMATIWSSTPQAHAGPRALSHPAAWRLSHRFRAPPHVSGLRIATAPPARPAPPNA